MNELGKWDEREEVEWLKYTVQPPLEIITGDYYIARHEYFSPPFHLDVKEGNLAGIVSPHKGRIEVVVNDGEIVFVEFNETAMDKYYAQYFAGKEKRRTDYGIWQASKERTRKEGVVLVDAFLHAEAQIMERQSLEGDFDLLTNASGTMSNMYPIVNKFAEEIKKPSSKKFYSVAEDFGYGITGWLKVIIEDGKIISCKYDEIFADHMKDILHPELKRYYKQSKYYSINYEDPDLPGWGRHWWSVNFPSLMDFLEERVIEKQDLFDIEGLPYTDGKNIGAIWDTDKPFTEPITDSVKYRYPPYDNYLKLAKRLSKVMPASFQK